MNDTDTPFEECEGDGGGKGRGKKTDSVVEN